MSKEAPAETAIGHEEHQLAGDEEVSAEGDIKCEEPSAECDLKDLLLLELPRVGKKNPAKEDTICN